MNKQGLLGILPLGWCSSEKTSTGLCNKTSTMVYLSMSVGIGGASEALLIVDSSDSKPPMHLLRAAGMSFACKKQRGSAEVYNLTAVEAHTHSDRSFRETKMHATQRKHQANIYRHNQVHI